MEKRYTFPNDMTLTKLSEEEFNKWAEETAVKINTFIDLYNKNELKETANWLIKIDDPILKLMVVLLAFSAKPTIPIQYVTIDDVKEKYSWMLEEDPKSIISKLFGDASNYRGI